MPHALSAGEKSAPPFLPGYNRFYLDSKDPADAVRAGQMLLGELGCVKCHAASPDVTASLSIKQAPILDAVGTRVKRGYFKRFLLDPQAAKPHSLMPNVLAALPAAEREAAAEALAHFLASTGKPRVDRPTPKDVATGKMVYKTIGCVACHGTRDAAGQADKTTSATIPLGDLKAKYTISSLAAFLATLPDLWRGGEVRPTHRSEPPRVRDWRTRKDPFEEVWAEILLWLQADPEA